MTSTQKTLSILAVFILTFSVIVLCEELSILAGVLAAIFYSSFFLLGWFSKPKLIETKVETLYKTIEVIKEVPVEKTPIVKTETKVDYNSQPTSKPKNKTSKNKNKNKNTTVNVG